MRIRRTLADWIGRQVRGLGSLAAAVGIVMAVLFYAVFSLGTATGEQGALGDSSTTAASGAESAVKKMQSDLPSLFIRALTDRPIALTAEIEVHGWKDRGQRIVDADISRIEPVENATRVAKNARAYPEGQISEQLSGQRVLASVSVNAVDALPEHGSARVALIVTPVGETATLVIDQVIASEKPGSAVQATSGAKAISRASAASQNPPAGATASSARVDSLSRYWGRPGTIVTMTGRGFGSSAGKSWVTCGGAKAKVSRWRDTSIRFKVPAGMKKQGYVGVVKNNRNSNGVYYSPFDRPVITGITPREGAPGTVVTLKGSSFGSSQSDGWVSFSGSTAQIVSWSNTQIRAIVPKDATSGYAGVVTHGMTSNGVLYGPLGAPLVTSVSASVLLPDRSVSIRGRGFGAHAGTVVVNGARVTPSYWSSTEVRFTVSSALRSGYVGVIRSDDWTSNGIWVPCAPRLASISNWWVRPLGELTLRGVAFGSTQGSRRAYIGGAEAIVTSWSDDEVRIQVPAGASSGYVGVGTRSACSNGIWVLVETPAHIDSVSQRLVAPGDLITIRGSGFGAATPTSKVVIGSNVCTCLSWADDEIVAVVPDGIQLSYVGVVKHGVSSNGVWVIPKSGD